MSSAADKNAEALAALLGSRQLADRLTSTRVAVRLGRTSDYPAGVLLRDCLAENLGRLWPTIEVSGSGTEAFVSAARVAAKSGGAAGNSIIGRWQPPYSYVIDIGESELIEQVSERSCTRLGANDWQVEIGASASCGNSSNPVGPAFAASIGSAQLFLRAFADELRTTDPEQIEKLTFDVREICGCPRLEIGALALGDTHIFGVGAVSHGAIWLLERWPQCVTGRLHLVDQDRYTQSNGQRYVGMQPADNGEVKVNSVAARLRGKHSELDVVPHVTDLNTYCAERGYGTPLERIVTGLDSEEARRHAGLKLPRRAINMWTAGRRAGAGRYLPSIGGACLVCEYPERLEGKLDETAQLAVQTGLRPDLVRDLLDSARPLRQEEAVIISHAKGVPESRLTGQPLRSILSALCATGSVVLPGSQEATDVPFVFSSLSAGIAGFMMLLKDLSGANESEGWVQNLFIAPNPSMHITPPSRKDCVCCGSADAIKLFSE